MRVYQVWDRVMPAATDTFCRDRKSADIRRRDFIEPSEIITHDVDVSKQGIIDALTHIPRREQVGEFLDPDKPPGAEMEYSDPRFP